MPFSPLLHSFYISHKKLYFLNWWKGKERIETGRLHCIISSCSLTEIAADAMQKLLSEC